MRFTIGFTCRHCGEDAHVSMDSSTIETFLHAKLLRRRLLNSDLTPILATCNHCGKTSGALHVQYEFREEWRPPHD